MYESTVHLRPIHPLEVSLLHPKSKGVFRLRGRLLSLASKRHPSDGPFHFWRNGSLHRSRRWHCPQGVLLARRRSASLFWQVVALLLWFYLGTRGFRKMLWRLPPIHFGKEDGVECTLLRVACQSEIFLAPPWQGGIDIRILWHIGCQSEFYEELSES